MIRSMDSIVIMRLYLFSRTKPCRASIHDQIKRYTANETNNGPRKHMFLKWAVRNCIALVGSTFGIQQCVFFLSFSVNIYQPVCCCFFFCSFCWWCGFCSNCSPNVIARYYTMITCSSDRYQFRIRANAFENGTQRTNIDFTFISSIKWEFHPEVSRIM